jgi:hypothetical protein
MYSSFSLLFSLETFNIPKKSVTRLELDLLNPIFPHFLTIYELRTFVQVSINVRPLSDQINIISLDDQG